MKVCPHCKSSYEDWIEFCFNDGAPLLTQETRPPAPATVPPVTVPPPAPVSVPSFLDAPDPRQLSAMDLPEPVNLRRAPGPPTPLAPTAAPSAAEPPGAGLPPVGALRPRMDAATIPVGPTTPTNPAVTIAPPALPTPSTPGAGAPVVAPAGSRPPIVPLAVQIPEPPAATPPSPVASAAPAADAAPPVRLPGAPPAWGPPPRQSAADEVDGEATEIPARTSPPPAAPAGLDTDVLRDLASAFADSGRATEPLPRAPESGEDGRATMPLATPWPEDAEPTQRTTPPPERLSGSVPTPPVRTPAAPPVRAASPPPQAAAPAKSALDDDYASTRVAGAGIGIALLGFLGVTVVVLGLGGAWWYFRTPPKPAVATADANKVEAPLPAPVAPPPAPTGDAATPPADAPTADASAGTPAPTGTPPAATTAAVTPPPTTTATKPPTPPATASTATQTTRTPPPTNTTRTTPPPATTPPPTSPATTPPPAPSTTVADASTSSDNPWGSPSEPTSGSLRILTDPDGATVYVNDTPKGRTPLTLELPFGVQHIRVVRAGYKTEVRDVNIRVKELTVPFNLKPEVVTGQVNVYGPDGFKVVVDGHDMGQMPVTVQVTEGLRQFKLVGPNGATCTLPKDIHFKTAGRPETVTLACP